MMEQDDIAFIDRYLLGELDTEELARFKQRLESEVEFKTLFNELAMIQRAFMKSEKDKALQRFESIEADLINESVIPISRKKPYALWGIAAACVGAFFLIQLVFSAQSEPDYQAIYKEHYEAYPNLIYPIKRGEPTELSNEKIAFQLYEKQLYTEAIVSLNSLEESDVIHFYLGNSHLALANEEEALYHYKRVGKSSLYYTQSLWYSAMAELNLEHISNCKELLQTLMAGDSEYAEKSKLLFNKIN